MEWIWTPKFEFHEESDPDEDQTEIFAHAHITRYVPPEKLIKQIYYKEGGLSQYMRVDDIGWLNHFEDHAKAYKTNNVLIYWGDDFAHIDADKTYSALEKLILDLEASKDERISKY